MPLPRFVDSDTNIPYELVWKCTKCGWANNTNAYNLGKYDCRLCGAPTKLLRVEYPQLCTDPIKEIS